VNERKRKEAYSQKSTFAKNLTVKKWSTRMYCTIVFRKLSRHRLKD